MANPEHVSLIKRSVDEWNRWRRENESVTPDFFQADLHGTVLPGAYLRNADLRNANLQNANLRHAHFRYATLEGANLRDADLRNADCRNTDLRSVDLDGAVLRKAGLKRANLGNAALSNADLSYADLSEAILEGADLLETDLKDAVLFRTRFSQAMIGNTIFGNVDLSSTQGLESIIHRGPSIISIDTLYLSGGKIPESFLRGAGVPESLITQIPSLVGAIEGIQFYSCFISYSHEDEEFCRRLHSRMRDEKLRVWLASEDMPWGQKLHEEIETQIRFHDKLLLVLSPASMNSEWVTTEIYHARQRELKENRRVLFPIALCPFSEIRAWKCFDTDTGKDLAREIREYLIGDFVHWKDHDAFEAAFAKLLKALKAK